MAAFGQSEERTIRALDRADHVTVLKQANPEHAAELMVSQVVAKEVTGLGIGDEYPSSTRRFVPLHSPGSAGAAQGDEA